MKKHDDFLRLQYEKLASIEENSLFHFFAAVHLSGIRLFTNRTDAAAFAEKSVILNSPFNQELCKAYGLDKTAGKALIEFLAKEIRGNNKNEERLLTKLQGIEEFTGAKNDNKQLPSFLKETARLINKDSLWAANQKTKRFEAMCLAGKNCGFDIPPPPPMKEDNYCIIWDKEAAGITQHAKFLGKDWEINKEYIMHQLVSYAANLARKEKEGKISEADIKTILLSDTGHYNALNWLFNPTDISELKFGGLKFFTETSDEEIKEKIGVEINDKLIVIKNIAKELLNHKGIPYNNFRSLFGGNIASGISNYWKRLKELRDGINKIIGDSPRIAVNDTQIAEKFKQTAISIENFQELLEDLMTSKESAENAIKTLMGEGESIAGKDEVEAVESFNEKYEECRGLAMQLAEVCRTVHNNNCENELNGLKNKDKHKKGTFTAIKTMKLLPIWLMPKNKNEDEGEDATQYLKRKINRYRGAEIFSFADIKKRLIDDDDKLKELREERDKHWVQIKNLKNDIVSAREKTEKERIENDKRSEHDCKALACRWIIQRMARVIRNCDNNVRKKGIELFSNHNIFDEKETCNKFFLHNEGVIYKSPYSDGKRDAYELSDAYKRDISGATKTLFNNFSDFVSKPANNDKSLRDIAQLENCLYAIRIGGLLSDTPHNLAKPSAHLELEYPAALRLALDLKRDLTPDEMAKIFNAYAGEISGLCARLSRETVIVKSRLQHIGDKSFYWLPKADKDWKQSQRTLQDGKPLTNGWAHLQSVEWLNDKKERQTLVNDGKITAADLPMAVESLSKMNDKDAFHACLRQMPHSWYFKTGDTTGNYPMLKPEGNDKHKAPINKEGSLCGLVEVTKNKIAYKKNNHKPAHYIRLAGPSRFKGWLDKALIRSDKVVSFGDTSLIIEEEYKQTDGKTHYDKTRLQAATVFNVAMKAGDFQFPYGRFIAIDLGERGIGYAVFDVPKEKEYINKENIEPIDFGHVAVPILRHLMKRVDNYRSRKQPRQRFQSNLNTSLQQMREATIGELAGIIDAWIEKHQAFPVFESTVGGFESGGRMLKIIYGSILRLYTYSDIDAHKSKRAHHWLTKRAPMWKHQDLLAAKDKKPLSLFPGVAVGPAGTSQMCSWCQKNPLTIIDTLKENKTKISLSANNDGILKLGNDDNAPKIYIYDYPNKEQKNKSRQHWKNPLPATWDIMKNKKFKNLDDLRKHVKDMLRHKALSIRSKDTSQSSYLSPFVDVQKTLIKLGNEELKKRRMFKRGGLVFMHADVNAAINIGRKWWKEKIWRDGE